MKVLIVSDTHGNLENLERVRELESGIEQVYHLGDIGGQEEEVRRMFPCSVGILRGNNDFDFTLPEDMNDFIGGHKIFLCHGHRYACSFGLRQLCLEAVRRKAEIVLYGHTHYATIDWREDILFINPGSLTRPRQTGRRPSYAILELDAQGELHWELKFL